MADKPKKQRRRHHLTPGQKLLVTAALLIILGLCGTFFLNFSAMERMEEEADAAEPFASSSPAYVLVGEGETTATFYNEGFAPVGQYGRGTDVQLESWEPFVTEDGKEYYHAYLDGQRGYIPCVNVTDDQTELLQESQVYVRSTVNLFKEPGGLELGSLATKGTLLRIVGYDYFDKDGTVNMYQVKMGEEFGWIKSEYTSLDYGESMGNYNVGGVWDDHVFRGDAYGGGDAGDLDYWPHEVVDFTDEGNPMPQDVYGLLIPPYHANLTHIDDYLELAEGTEINAFVVTICEEGDFAYESDWMRQYDIPGYVYENSVDECRAAINKLKDAGYYVIGRINTFSDRYLAEAYPQWSISDMTGSLLQMSGTYWPSAFSRDVWKLRVGFAAEAVDLFGFNEIQFDYVRFPDYIINYEEDGNIDLKNTLGESRAQAVQRFLTYASDILHEHDAYVGACMFGETTNPYVAPYGQYWSAVSDVVDVICGMPYPDHFDSYHRTNYDWFIPYKRPYMSNLEWAQKAFDRQEECGSPAVARTWIQTWDDYDYEYNALNIQRQIVALYDADLRGGYMLWSSQGSLEIADKLKGVVEYDYGALYDKAEAEHVLLSEYMDIPTEDYMLEGADPTPTPHGGSKN